MIVEFHMLLEDSHLKQKYVAAFNRKHFNIDLSYSMPLVVSVREDIVSINPCLGHECDIRAFQWNVRFGTVIGVKNEPLPEKISILIQNDTVHLVIIALLSETIDSDQMVQGLKLDYSFGKPPCKFIRNYLTGGYVFRELRDNSYDDPISFGEFISKWMRILDVDLSYKEIHSSVPDTLVGRLQAFRR